MNINATYFCSLSTSPIFLDWLCKFSQDICIDLLKHTRQSHSCSENTTKMIDVYNQIIKQPDGEIQLKTFLNNKFPHILMAQLHIPVFEYYDSSLLTIPRRLILNSEDEARKFLIDKIGEYVIVDNKAYIEYLPPNLSYLLPSIPSSNWKVKIWRANRQQK